MFTRGGTELFCNNLDMLDSKKPLSEQHTTQDLINLEYSDCAIDGGQYCNCLIINVVKLTKDGIQDWQDVPYATIVCYTVTDFFEQLQRAIDVYPGNINL
jgi:hypothetical protein